MKAVSVFNNKGGVGKTTLTFHLGYALAEMGKKVLLVDLDPQCNLSIYSLTEDQLFNTWKAEDSFIEDFDQARRATAIQSFNGLLNNLRTAHFMLKPIEDGLDDLESPGLPVALTNNLHLIPGRLTLHMFEDKLSSRWSDIYRGDPLAIRTITKIRDLVDKMSIGYGYDYVLFDTSPSLGTLNKVIISTSDGILLPCAPDMFSLYGIQNIGRALSNWKKEFDTVFRLISTEKRTRFPEHFVQLIGYTVFNAKRYSGGGNAWSLANAHYNFAKQIPSTIQSHIREENRMLLKGNALAEPLGSMAIMHTHNTFPSMAQKYRVPMWLVPSQALEPEDKGTVAGNRVKYEETRASYHAYAAAFMERLHGLPA
jgi:cellulose biosynthesis protein BcsQ